ncbi:MAG: hypothetical protein IJJ28_02695 [Lentisphaeria bacterium]|nr:hypothetical protein [Lentisphaeria bacterium]
MSDNTSTLKIHCYRVSFGGRDLGILAEIPAIRVEHRCRELRLYDRDGSGEDTAEIMDSRAEITICSCDVATALELLAAFAPGDDVLAESRCRALVFSPPAGVPEKTLRFPRASLLPRLEYSPRFDNHRATLTFRARPDRGGTLFTFA